MSAISIYNRCYKTVSIFTLIWVLLRVNNIIYFYIIIEVSILYFVYLFYLRARKERRESLILIILYILVFSLPFIVVILSIETSIFLIKTTNIRIIVFIMVRMIFVNKMPLYGLHYWLLKAHSYCTTWGRVILARIILKVGVLGFIYIYQISYMYNLRYFKYFIWVGVIISRVNILFITDVKIMIAQTRVTHISFIRLSLLINNNMRIKLGIVFCYVHGVVRSMMFTNAESLMIFSKSRNILLFKQLYITTLIFIVTILINNSFPITPYMWCELWIFYMIISRKMIWIILIITIVLTCNILFYNWLVMIKYQYILIISDLKFTYIIVYIFLGLRLFFIL